MKKRLLISLLAAIPLLNACNEDEMNTVRKAELSDREKSILSASSNHYSIFDYTAGDEFSELNLWIEEYENGELIKNVANVIVSVSEEGSIIFSSNDVYLEDPDKSLLSINLSVTNEDGNGSTSFTVEPPEDSSRISAEYGEETLPIEGEIILSYFAYSNDDIVSSLAESYFEDPDANAALLKQYDAIYVMKGKFN
ncbi:hypothetical protein P6709_13665 [Jeotgalibacillus sp. ET6]|uniref:hypothetical protein n=1 Tax=Jeotgalibacillus sp. ET6 TaxID=3037260 RepID=UPI0024186EAA|nr:hypothetical protein [Jeotgalibacillus sp. ET6]MDG5472800.1 hypothetical protein [Jeotgalibacillus sp. ET6]